MAEAKTGRSKEDIAKGSVDGAIGAHDKAVAMAGDQMLRGASKPARYVMKTVAGAPGKVLDIVEVA